MRQLKFGRYFLCLTTSTLLAAGCGGGPPDDAPELIEAFGTVTLDDQPLRDAQVMFTAPNQAPVSGRTNAEGFYEMEYNDTLKGAFPGQNDVRINIGLTYEFDADEEDEEEEEEMSRINLPAKYNSMTTLSANVVEGGAPYDFQLESD